MNRTTRLVLIAVVVAALQIGFLSARILGRAAILRDGREVVLEVRPIDPRDLLRGEYVRLGYNISQIPAAMFDKPVDETIAAGTAVYVRLKPGEDGIWQPVAARFDEPPEAPAAPEEVDIRGKLETSWAGRFERLPVEYGIERFYVPEGQASGIQSNLRERSFTMKVAVADDGTAQIKALLDGDTLVYREPVY